MAIPGMPQLNIPGLGGPSPAGAPGTGGFGGTSPFGGLTAGLEGGGNPMAGFGLPGLGGSASPASSGNSVMSPDTASLVSMLGVMMGGLMTMIAGLLMGLLNGSISGTAPPGSGGGGTSATPASSGGGGSNGAGGSTGGGNNTGSSNTQPIGPGRNPDGSNVRATQTLEDYKKRFGVTNLGIWGDEAHQRRKSDHNTGDAVDLGVSSIEQGNQVTDALLQEVEERGIKYIIFNNRIWSAERRDEGWRPYTGSNPHTSHVHVSFNA